MSKGFNPNPKAGTIYLSIKNQLKKMIEHHQSNQDSIPIFTTSSKRFPILKEVVHELANQMPDLKFSVFSDEKCCGVCQHIPLNEDSSYTWVKQSEISGKWLVFAKPPGATICASLTVWNKKEDAENVATEILDSIREFPLDEWNKKHRSKYYRNFLKNLPDDDDGYIANI